jgi:hypothetical protein
MAGVVCLCAASGSGHDAEDPDVVRARAGIERLRALWEAGAVARAQLEQAEETLLDAQDLAVLHRTMYAADLTGEQAGEMIGAAQRRLVRRQKHLEKVRRLVDAGVAARAEVGTFLEEVDYARKEYDLAVSRADLCRELAEMARAEQSRQLYPREAPVGGSKLSEHYDGSGVFTPAVFQQVQEAFERRFAKSLPVSAIGETAAHRALGFDHRGRVDVALNPDQPEGIWLRRYLESRRIPYFAFRHAVTGKATGAHIHLGPESARLALSSRLPRASGAAD